MTQATSIDDAAATAVETLKSADAVVRAFNVLSAEHRGALQQSFPTLNTALAMLAQRWKSLGT